jgi:hypothetical protein
VGGVDDISFTGLGYERGEVDAFRSAVRDTFLGVSEPAVRSDDLRGKQFSAHRLGYEKTEVEAFVEAAGLRLAAMESTDRPEAGALVSGAILAGWAEWVESTGFSRVTGPACKAMEVDAFQEAIRDTFLGVRKPPMRSDEVLGKQFSSTDADHGVYDKWQVAAFLEAAAIRLAAMESTERPENHWLAMPFSPNGPSGPTQQDFQPPARGRATRRRRSTRSDKRFATRSSGSCNPRSPWMRPATSGSGWPGGVATTCSRLTPSVMKPNRSWRRCGRPTGDDATEARHRLSRRFQQSGREFMLTQ